MANYSSQKREMHCVVGFSYRLFLCLQASHLKNDLLDLNKIGMAKEDLISF